MILAIDASRANKYEKTGVEWYSYFLIQEFKKIIPVKTKVILYSLSSLREDLLPLPQNWESRVLRWPFPFWTLKRLSLEMLFHKPDILFVPSHIIPFFSPKNTFTTIHDIGFKRFPECYRTLQKKILEFGIKRAKKAKKIFAPSEFTKKELVDICKIPENKIIVTHLGYNDVYKKTENNEPSIKKPYLFYIGRLEKKKNIENIIKAFKLFSKDNPDYTLILAGNKNPKFNIPKSTPKIQTLGWVSNENATALMANAEIFLYPSLYEGFGIPILEAFACGTPVITSDRASMPEIAGDAALLVNPDSPEEIKNTILKIINNYALKKSLIEKGYNQCKKFNWQKCAEKTLNEILK
ncbi:MAG: hypothetical protein COU51_02290 [Parcubacteria group bacterium CG10_big_fil_rev_8_21_14_0_10_36_14]|nr:MAG: hypothetical protein COU51_02290 [Parcubacteria group bacterium CG10_big_fil_rev_8_21_14_0_10_36_14]